MTSSQGCFELFVAAYAYANLESGTRGILSDADGPSTAPHSFSNCGRDKTQTVFNCAGWFFVQNGKAS